MDRDIFKERGRSFEEEYFKKHEAKLLAKLRERDRLDAIAEELAVKLQIDSPGLLVRIIRLGVTLGPGARKGPGHRRRDGRREGLGRPRTAGDVAARATGRRVVRRVHRSHQGR